MVINPNILTISPLFYSLLIVPIIAIYTYAKWAKEKYTTGIAMCILDILPAFFLFTYNVRTPLLDLFIVFILLAMISIRVHTAVGAAMYLIVYLTIGITFLFDNFKLDTLLISLVAVLILIGYMYIYHKNLNKWTKLGGTIYGLFAIVPLLYCFGITSNWGFLSLVIGDLLLAITQIIDKKYLKVVNYVSNIFFYVGVWFSALSLV